MPYKHKKDKAKQMRRYRARKKQEKQTFLAKLDPTIRRQLLSQFPTFLSQKKKKRKK